MEYAITGTFDDPVVEKVEKTPNTTPSTEEP
jgi:hypothetical protein